MGRCLTSPPLGANHAGSHALPDSSGTDVWKAISAQGGHERAARVAQRGHSKTGALALVDACRSMRHRVHIHIHPILHAVLHRSMLTIQAGMQLGVFLLPLRACYLANPVEMNLFLGMQIWV